MIWNSVPLMTAIDLLIIAVTIYAIWRCRLIGPGRRPAAPRVGLWLVALGLLALCLFYLTDLASMYILRAITSAQDAMAFMDTLHRNLSWLVVMFAVITIVTGFVELLVELQNREARIRRLIDSNIIGVFIWGFGGQIIDANEAFLRIVGYGREELVSGRLHWRELTPTDWRDADDQCAAKLKATGTARPYEKEFFQRDGGRVPVLVGAVTFEGSRDEGLAFVLDLTDRKRAEDAFRESERRYHEMQMELAHANRLATMGQLTTSIAHEVNQPIAATVTNAQAALRWLAHRPPDLEEVRHALRRIVENSNRASDVIDSIRALIKKAPPREDRFEINGAVQEVIKLAHSEAVKNGVVVQTELAKHLPIIRGDRVQLQQVMLNLVINAVEAMSGVSDGVKELVISTGDVETNGVFVAVGDSGPGLSLMSVERVFDPFYTTKLAGLGLGLSICRSIVEAHGGRLWVTANQPRGAIFQFTVPATQAASN